MVGQAGDHAAAERGLLADCPVATPDGWHAAGTLRSGDAVWCLDGPPQPIRATRRTDRRSAWAVRVPRTALGNAAPLVLACGQPVALELDQAAALYGDPVALVPALALVGWRGILRCRAPAGDRVHLGFARRQVIYAGPGLLLGCDGADDGVLCAAGPPAPSLTEGQAAHLMACVMAQEIGAALRRQAALAAAKRP